MINLFKNVLIKENCRIDDECKGEIESIQANHVNTGPKVEPLTFYDMERPVLFITSIYDSEKLIKKSLILSTELVRKLISINVTNQNALIFYSHAIRYILDDISGLSIFIDELSKEDLMDTIEKASGCLSELYSCCIIIKENCKDDFSYMPIYRILDDIINLIEQYIKVKDEKIDYEELYNKISLKEIQNMITNEIGKCGNANKLNEIRYIVTMLLREDSREVEDVAEIIRKRRRINDR